MCLGKVQGRTCHARPQLAAPASGRPLQQTTMLTVRPPSTFQTVCTACTVGYMVKVRSRHAPCPQGSPACNTARSHNPSLWCCLGRQGCSALAPFSSPQISQPSHVLCSAPPPPSPPSCRTQASGRACFCAPGACQPSVVGSHHPSLPLSSDAPGTTLSASAWFDQRLTPTVSAQASTPPTAQPSAARPGSRASRAAQTSGARAPRARQRPRPARSAAPATSTPALWATSTAPRRTTAGPCRATAGLPAPHTPAPSASSESIWAGDGSPASFACLARALRALPWTPQTGQVPSPFCFRNSTCRTSTTLAVWPPARVLCSSPGDSVACRPTALPPFDLAAPRRPLFCSNPGGNSRKCSPCPGGLSTLTTGTANVQNCAAGPGYYQLQGKAVAVRAGG
jgi:hypothetical protein